MARFASLFCALVLFGALPAHAQTEVEQARAAYQKANTEYNLGNYADAVKYFEEVYRLKPVPALLFNIAQCHRFTGDLEKAATTYRAYLRNAPASDKNVGRAKELLAEVEKALAQRQHAEKAPPHGLAAGEVAPPVSAHATSPAPAKAAPAALPPIPAVVKQPQTAAAAVVGKPPPASAPATNATTTQAPAAPPPAAPPPAATQAPASKPSAVAIANASTQPASERHDPPARTTAPVASTTPAPAPAQPEKGTKVFTWVAAGGAVAALGAGGYFGAQSKSLVSNLQSSPHSRAQIDADSATAKSDASKGTLLLGAGAVLAVAATLFFVFDF